MKRITLLCLCIFSTIILSGCMSMRTDTQAPEIASDEIPNLAIKQPVTLENASTNPGESVIGKWPGWTVYADYQKYTESAIGAVKNVFESKNITVNDNAQKVLKLDVYEALSEQGMVKFRFTAKMKVVTGSGVQKEFTGIHNYGNGYGTTFAAERSIAQCVAQMLNDKDILKYLEE